MPSDLKTRTGDFALRIITLYSALPTRGAGYVLGLQVLKSGTSVGAHHREACRAKSNADFVSEIEGALQELDETAYWLELIGKANLLGPSRLESLLCEAEQLTAIFVTIVKKIKTRSRSLKRMTGKNDEV